MNEFLVAFDEVSMVRTYSFVTKKFGKDSRMLHMDWMIAFVMMIAVSVCRLSVYCSVNGVSVVNFYSHI